MTQCTTGGTYICPELSRYFPNTNGSDNSHFSSNSNTNTLINGEIDFYLNGKLRWGIELLVQGKGITEHLSRFDEEGKYNDLKVLDYRVVDFRVNSTGDATNVIPNDKCITVFFKSGEYSSCKVVTSVSGIKTIEDVKLC